MQGVVAAGGTAPTAGDLAPVGSAATMAPVMVPGRGPQRADGSAVQILLMLHVLCAVVGFGTMVVTGVQAGRARRGPSAPGADAVRRYFRPGVNWAGRALYGVPVFGFGLIAASDGAFASGDGFVVVGLVVWLVAALLAEVVVWPGERRIQVEVTEAVGSKPRVGRALDRDCRQVGGGAAVLAIAVRRRHGGHDRQALIRGPADGRRRRPGGAAREGPAADVALADAGLPRPRRHHAPASGGAGGHGAVSHRALRQPVGLPRRGPARPAGHRRGP